MRKVADKALLSRIESGLELVEAALLKATEHTDPIAKVTARHLVDAGGKRIRPALVLLAAQRMTTAVCRTKNMILMTAFVSKTVMPIRTTRMHKKQRSNSRRKPRRN